VRTRPGVSVRTERQGALQHGSSRDRESGNHTSKRRSTPKTYRGFDRTAQPHSGIPKQDLKYQQRTGKDAGQQPKELAELQQKNRRQEHSRWPSKQANEAKKQEMAQPAGHQTTDQQLQAKTCATRSRCSSTPKATNAAPPPNQGEISRPLITDDPRIAQGHPPYGGGPRRALQWWLAAAVF